MSSSSGLRPLNRLITTHNAQGKAVFSDAFAEELPEQPIATGDKFFLGYTTSEYPPDLTDDKDLGKYKAYMADKPGIVVPGGSVLRYVDIKPGGRSPMHRTVSIDYGVVIEGEVILELDSGETRSMKRGDVAIQRSTMHAWYNPHPTEWARMIFVLQECKPIVIDGKRLGEDYGVGMDGIKPSGN